MKIKKIIVLVLMFLIFFSNSPVEAKTLRDLKNELSVLKQKKQNAENEKKLTENEISNVYKNIDATTNKITESEATIEKLTDEITELNEKAKKRELEIKEVMHFLQISNGESAYLEYIFGAKDITDFIYRSAISGQLVTYNEGLIDEYNDTIKKNQKKQEDLKIEMENLAKKQEELEGSLVSLGSELIAISDVSMSIDEEIISLEKAISYYEKDLKCGIDENINNCGSVPYSGGFARPVVNGRITSVFGWRCYTRNNGQYYCGNHNGIDLAGGDTRIYAAAPGIVVAIQDGAYIKRTTGKYACGGNKVFIIHNVNGQKYTSAYFHLNSWNVSVGDYVDQNTVIGIMGGGSNTWWYDNCTTGTHLHFAIATGHYLKDYSTFTQYEARNINPASVVNFPARGVWFSNRVYRY